MKLPARLLCAVLLVSPALHAADDKASTPAAAELSTQTQKFSYAVGVQIAASILNQGVKIDADAFSLAVHDAVSGGKFRLTPEEMQSVVEAEKKATQEKAKALADQNQKTGDDFRGAYQKKDGVKALPSGILYRILKEGKGKIPSLTDTVECNYTGRHTNGQVFDSSTQHGSAATFELDKVIKGWQEALKQMPEGSKWEFVIPPDLAYGSKGAGGVIGPNETLVFEVELVAVKAAAAAAPAAPKQAP